MTVCIAALAEDGRACALCSDQMITAHFPIGYEFESPEVAKIPQVCGDTCVLLAGDILFAHEVIRHAQEMLEDLGATVASGVVAERIRRSYAEIRLERIVQTHLSPRGLTLENYYSMHQQLHSGVVQRIDGTMEMFDPGVEMIVAGMDGGVYHLFTVTNPGTMVCNDPIGFCAVGSGAPHATYSMIDSGYRKSLELEAVTEMVRQAKKRSEVAPGVGQSTNIRTLGKDREENADGKAKQP